ncbi:MAG: RNA polymerase sigma factor RpoD/SigA [Candidatus Tectomicrobia bacterium]|uniref:RNA polymerase sigma factor RpoD/SigA n=1 Tax=Tectimicrobiota bacterium TaxID=2528274 RepID=A0A932MNR6_UNCTE|nr:RNA polymerase sigma factor RpoD/SigA [Candidatus Tectomicrobia bacterium]
MAKKRTSSGIPKTKRPRKKPAVSESPAAELEEETRAEEAPEAGGGSFLEEMEREPASQPPSEDTLAIYLREIGQYPILTREEEHELAVRAKDGDMEAFNRLVRCNLRYVVSVANRYKGFGLSLEDLINEGNIGLIHAIRRFDPYRGVKLITYAVWWIRQSIMHAIADHTGTVRLPIKQAGLIHKIGQTYQRLRQEMDREPSSEELAEGLNMKMDDVENILRVHRNYLSLDTPIAGSEETSYLDLLEAKDVLTAEDNLVQHSLEEEIEDLLAGLDPREREIIRLRFGFDGDPMTLEEIGQRIGLSRERIRQIEKKIIRRFRARAKNKPLLDYLR